MTKTQPLICFTFFLIAFGCTKVSQKEQQIHVASIVESRIDKEVYWNHDQSNEQIAEAVNCLLSQELTADSVVQIALLNNPQVQTTFSEIGIGYADLIDAGLFQNPIFDLFLRYPNQHGLHLNTEFTITQGFLDVFLIPLRKKVATAEFEKTKFRVANTILNLAFDTQETYFQLIAEQKINYLLELSLETADAANELAKAQKKQGNINDLELQTRYNDFLEAKIKVSQSQIEVIRLTECLNKLLALSSSIRWKLSDDFPPLPPEEPSEYCLEAIALAMRLDLEAERWEVERIVRMMPTKEWWAYTNLAAGFAYEKDPGGALTQGPALTGAIPIFNYGQADRARLAAMYDQSLNRLKTKEIDVLAEVRSARDRLSVQRCQILVFKNELLPLQENIVLMSQRYYNGMALGVYKLLNAKNQEIRMQINFTIELRNYWMARIELDRALGGNLNLAAEAFEPLNCLNIP